MDQIKYWGSEELHKLTCRELQILLKHCGLNASGSKNVLVRRLVEYNTNSAITEIGKLYPVNVPNKKPKYESSTSNVSWGDLPEDLWLLILKDYCTNDELLMYRLPSFFVRRGRNKLITQLLQPSQITQCQITPNIYRDIYLFIINLVSKRFHFMAKRLKTPSVEFCTLRKLNCSAFARFGHLSLVKWASSLNLTDGVTIQSAAALGGHVHILSWLVEDKMRLPRNDWIIDIACYAAYAGNLSILEWIKKISRISMIWSPFQCAAFGGKVNILEWISQNDKKEFNQQFYDLSQCACNAATFGGKIESLEWLYKKYEHIDPLVRVIFPSAEIGNIAIMNSRFSVLDWLLKIEADIIPFFRAVINFSFMYKNDEAIEWALNHNCPLDLILPENAIKLGPLWLLDKLKANKTLPENLCDIAAGIRNSVSVLQWAKDNDFKWNAKTCSIAAHRGNLSTLKWLRENGCPWDSSTIKASLPHRQCLLWALKNGCPIEDLSPPVSKRVLLELFSILNNRDSPKVIQYVLDEVFHNPDSETNKGTTVDLVVYNNTSDESDDDDDFMYDFDMDDDSSQSLNDDYY